MSTDVAVYKAGLPTLTAEQVRARTTLVQQVLRGVMKAGIHYGQIPGAGDKPMLFKPGAETLAVTFQLATEPHVEDLSTDDSVRYRVTVTFTSQQTGAFLGTGVGEASSDEEKYRWRKAVCDQEFEETPEDRRRVKWGKGKGGSTYQVKQVRTSPPDVANTILKMAKKRAQVDGTLSVTGASDIFGQDMEDLPEELRTVDAEYVAEVADSGEIIGPEDYQALLAEMARTGLSPAAVAKNLEHKANYTGPLEDMPVRVYEPLMAGLRSMKSKAPQPASEPAAEEPNVAAETPPSGDVEPQGETEPQEASPAPESADSEPPVSQGQLRQLGIVWRKLSAIGYSEEELRDLLQQHTGQRSRKVLTFEQAHVAIARFTAELEKHEGEAA